MKHVLSPSILSADFSRLAEEVRRLESLGIKEIHLDVMDGHFVPNITIGPPVIKSLRKETEMFFDVHLMITKPAKYFDSFMDAGADGITCHVEAKECEECIKMSRESGIRSGIAINPETPIEKVSDLLEKVDVILVMTVHPGFGGQKLIRDSLKKIGWLREAMDKEKMDVRIQVDGGVNMETIEDVLESGADIIVSGSGIFRGNVRRNIKNMIDIIEKFEGKG